MAYVDDVNSILHHSDIQFFLDRFHDLGSPLGAILNTEKTRILTTTSGQSVVDIDRMKAHQNIGISMAGVALEETIAEYSTTKIDGNIVPVEVTDGLSVLGAPIGSTEFCQNFIMIDFNGHNLMHPNYSPVLMIYRQHSASSASHPYICTRHLQHQPQRFTR
jgi:hypothetical protein